MKNVNFEVEIDHATGFLTALRHPGDPHRMNLCAEGGTWGRMYTEYDLDRSAYHKEAGRSAPLLPCKVEVSEDGMCATYQNNKVAVAVTRSFCENGNLRERVSLTNISPSVLCINRDNFGVEFPLNDRYAHADDCMTARCHTHIWCGVNTTWINALRMGPSDINLGMVLTKGAFISYSQKGCETNVRGSFVLEPETLLLKRGESYTWEWELFWHTGKSDFFQKLASYPAYIGIEAPHFTLFEGEPIIFTVRSACQTAPVVTCEGEAVPATETENGYSVSYLPKKRGRHIFTVRCGDVVTYTEFMVKVAFETLLKTRVHFIVERQQCLDRESPLYGAYLLYDNTTSSPYFDFLFTDHNAGRERLNMPLVLIRYLQLYEDAAVRRSLDLFIEFLFREFYEEKTGEVFNNIGKTADALRLYNAPGVMLVFAEMYYLTKEDRYLDNILRLAEKYYSIGGEHCYSNAVAIRKVLGAFALSGRTEESEKMRRFFLLHVKTMMQNGRSYPIHEVNYEQTIVTPAVTCISEMGLFTEEKEAYMELAGQHLACLDRFSGNQPSFHLHEIAILFWDDFWFGKAKKFGDTMPHHLSCLSARAFAAYARLTGDKTYVERAEECIRNCLCLIDDDGAGHAAYVYPHCVNGLEGEFYDEWANDQDLPLYDAMNCRDLVKAFS